MKKIVWILLLIVAQNGWSQNDEYSRLVELADSFYMAKDYLNTAFSLSAAFKVNGGWGKRKDRYWAGCAWALAEYPDSAFYNLQRAAINGRYSDYDYISNDNRLVSLHNDERWQALLECVRENKAEIDAKLDKPLVAVLDSIQNSITQNVDQINNLVQKHGYFSQEYQNHLQLIQKSGPLNIKIIQKILDSRGWPDEELIGIQGSQTISLVLEQADVETIEKYLPLLRESVKKRKQSARILEGLEDEYSLKKTGRQIYGSICGFDPSTRQYFILPLEDPDNVDKRRAELGLVPLSKFAKISGIKWDVEQYKKDLPRLIEIYKNRRK